jgi:hypothetical protein
VSRADTNEEREEKTFDYSILSGLMSRLQHIVEAHLTQWVIFLWLVLVDVVDQPRSPHMNMFWELISASRTILHNLVVVFKTHQACSKHQLIMMKMKRGMSVEL